jgi:hypothetical protein
LSTTNRWSSGSNYWRPVHDFLAKKFQKSGRGRPKGGISEAARWLPITGKSHEAKRKNVERALIVDRIFPEAKEAIKKAGLDQNRSKYRKVAAERTPEAQLAKVEELTAPKTDKTEKRGLHATKQKTSKAGATTSLPAKDEKVVEQLFDDWKDAVDLRRRFINASPSVRERVWPAPGLDDTRLN